MKGFLLSFFSYRQAEALRTFLYAVLYYSGLARFLSWGKTPGASILCYHSVRSGGVFSDNAMSEETFRKQIDFLRTRYEIVSLPRLIIQLKSGNPVPGNWVVLTFDDGYGDNARTVLPILREAGVTGSFYPATDVVRREFVFFYDKIQNMLERFPHPAIELELNGRREKFRLGSQSAIDDAALRVVLSIRNKPLEERETFVKVVSKATGLEPKVAEDIYLTEAEVLLLAKSGMEVGSHTQSHANLKILSDKDLHQELEGSKEYLEKLTEGPVRGFSYPFGKKIHWDKTTQEAVREAGYQYANTTVFGRVQQGLDLYALPRMAMPDTPLVRLKVNLMGIQI